MASRMKKLFHRKKDSDAEQPPQRSPASNLVRSDPALRTSRYESTEPGDPPQSGIYPVKGNDSTVILQQGRKSSISRSRRNSATPHNRSITPNQNEASKRAPHMIPPIAGGGPNDHYQQSSAMPIGDREERRRQDLPQDLHGLNLAQAESPTTVTQTVTTIRTPHQTYNANRGVPQEQGNATRSNPQEQGYGLRNNATPQRQEYYRRDNTTPQHHEVGPQYSTDFRNREYALGADPADTRPINEEYARRDLMPQSHPADLSSNQRSNAYSSPSMQDGYDEVLARQDSIPRKKIGTSANTPRSSGRAPSPPMTQVSHSRQQSATKPLPSTPAAASQGNTDRQMESASWPSSTHNRSRPNQKSYSGLRDAQDVVDRAKTNTYDTQVIETVAPAVVHEKVHKAVHHVREEVITREIHTHDVFHRIQPIVDVEVLPPRHFLPVEGGGLVEIGAQEVPGRGSNWVIAETASKIPSDQAAPPRTTQFTARKFPGREGDTEKYISPEGYEKSHQTWVHPPELEEGARLTGQSWPMVVGEDAAEKGERGLSGSHGSTPRATKRKSPKKNPAIQASPAQRAGGGAGRA